MAFLALSAILGFTAVDVAIAQLGPSPYVYQAQNPGLLGFVVNTQFSPTPYHTHAPPQQQPLDQPNQNLFREPSQDVNNGQRQWAFDDDNSNSQSFLQRHIHSPSHSHFRPSGSAQLVNNRYPLTPPTLSLKYRIGVISDLDMDALDGEGETVKWKSYLKEGWLQVEQNGNNPSTSNITIAWSNAKTHTIKSGLAYSGRGMELSTLNAFNGKLYACDDKTGVVYQLPVNGHDDGLDIGPVPWAILADGNFTGPNGFKCEWATIKDGHLWIGGHGKHIYNSTTGEIVNSNDRFIKKISPEGQVTHHDWSENFDKMAEALGIHLPGYVIHEAAGWSDILQKWIFMPRKISREKYEPESDLQTGSNMFLLADENFDHIEVRHVLGSRQPTHGFSGFKFIPGTMDEQIVALRTTTKENKEDLKSFITAFDLQGNVLLEETEISDQKFEGVEFL